MLTAKFLKGSQQNQQLSCPFAGALAEVAFAQRFERDGGIDQAVAQIAQRLPERGAAAGAIFDAGEGLGAGLARANNLPERFFEKQIVLKLKGRAAALGLEPKR